jgi:hypothetical protein
MVVKITSNLLTKDIIFLPTLKIDKAEGKLLVICLSAVYNTFPACPHL